MKLENYLFENKIQKTAFAEKVGISNVKLSKLLHGRVSVDMETANKIREATDGKVTFEDWLEDETQPS